MPEGYKLVKHHVKYGLLQFLKKNGVALALKISLSSEKF